MHIHVKISGRVQGVCFRAWTRQEAKALGLYGWVRNCPDSSVDAVFEGEESKIKKMLELCRQGPDLADVRNVEVAERSGTSGLEDFRIL